MQAAIPCLSANKGLAEREKISEQISCHISVTNSNTHHHQGHCEDQLPFHLPDNGDGCLVTGSEGFYTYCGASKGKGRNFMVGFFYLFIFKTKMARDFWFVNRHLRNYSM